MFSTQTNMPRRRWLQFSLRTFLVVITLAAVGMGIWVHRVRNQQRAVEALTALGARIVYEHQWPAWAGLPGAAPFNQAEPPGPAWLRRWLGDAYFVKVVSVDFTECPERLTSRELVHLDSLSKLRLIVFSRKQSVTEPGFAHVARHTTLEEIRLPDPACIDDAVAKHLGKLTELYLLDLHETKITDAGLAHLAGLAKLTWLELRGTSVSDTGLIHLLRLTDLVHLGLRGTRIQGPGLRHVAALPKLEYLSLQETQIADAALADLSRLRCLRALNAITCPQITDTGLAHIAKLSGLRRLSVGSPQITDAGVAHLKGLVTLEWLYLRDGKISDAGLKYVKMLPNLEQLGLDGTDITEEGLAGLKGMQKLKHLQIRDTCIGQSEANRVHKALPNCFIRYGSRKGGSPKPIEPKGVTPPRPGA